MDEIKSPRQVLIDFEERVQEALRKSLIENNRVANGNLYGTIVATTKVYGQMVVMEIGMDSYGKFVNEGVNGRNVKYGSRFSFKKKNLPQIAMLNHIRDRGEILNPIAQSISRQYKNSKGEIKQRKKPLPMDKARKTLSFLLGRKITSNGLKPTNFVEEGLESGVMEDLKAELFASVGREIKVELKLEYEKK